MSPEYRATLRKSQLVSDVAVRNKQPLRMVTLVLALLSACFAISIIGTAADAYNLYRTESQAMNPWWLPLYPGHFNTRGTVSLIGASVAIFVLNIGLLILLLVPKLNFLPHSFRAMIVAVFHATASSLIGLASIAYNAILNRGSRSRETIQTWTCQFAADVPLDAVNLDGQPENMTNVHFSKMCTESKFAFWALVTIVILQALLFSIAIAQWVISLWSNTKREFGDDRPDTGTEMESQRDLKISEEFPKQQY